MVSVLNETINIWAFRKGVIIHENTTHYYT
jgi:hypothetical protein